MMDKQAAKKACKVMLEVALDHIERAINMADSVDSDEKWQAFDKACYAADFNIMDALCCAPDGFLPEDDEKKLISGLRKIQAIRTEAFINWQMKWREEEAIRNPNGKYGMAKARREALWTALQDEDGHQPRLN